MRRIKIIQDLTLFGLLIVAAALVGWAVMQAVTLFYEFVNYLYQNI